MKQKALFPFLSAILIFGTVGIFRKFMPFPSGMIAAARGFVGALVIFAFLLVIGHPFSFKAVKERLGLLCLSGMLMGFNWMLLFESYNHTSVAAATLCYYMAPVIVIALSPFIFKEHLGTKKILCVFAAVFGMVLVSGVLETGLAFSELKGVILALGAAFLYAFVVITNKKLSEVPATERTAIQLLSAAIAVLPYSVLTETVTKEQFTFGAVMVLITVGILHTGVAYVLYFESIGKLKAQTAAIFSYLDPVAAIILSAAVLKERIGAAEIIGTVLILGSAVLSEISTEKG